MGTNQKSKETLTGLVTLASDLVNAVEAAGDAIKLANVRYCEFAISLYRAINSGSTTASAVADALRGLPNMSAPNLVYYKLVGRMLSVSPDIDNDEFVSAVNGVGWNVATMPGGKSLHRAVADMGADIINGIIDSATSSVGAVDEIVRRANRTERAPRKKSDVDPNLRRLQSALDSVKSVQEQVSKGKAVLPSEATAVISEMIGILTGLLPAEVGSDSESFQTVAV